MAKTFIVLFAGVLILGTDVSVAEASRLRLMIPILASTPADQKQVRFNELFRWKRDSYSTSGYSVQYVTDSGWGLGYTSTTSEDTAETVPGLDDRLTTTGTFLDFSYTFGSEMTVQLVYGYQIGQTDLIYKINGWSGTEKYNLSIKSYSGSAWAINGGYDLGSFEVLLGYRSESTSVTAEKSSESDPYWPEVIDGNIEHTLVSAGIGFTF